MNFPVLFQGWLWDRLMKWWSSSFFRRKLVLPWWNSPAHMRPVCVGELNEFSLPTDTWFLWVLLFFMLSHDGLVIVLFFPWWFSSFQGMSCILKVGRALLYLSLYLPLLREKHLIRSHKWIIPPPARILVHVASSRPHAWPKGLVRVLHDVTAGALCQRSVDWGAVLGSLSSFNHILYLKFI